MQFVAMLHRGDAPTSDGARWSQRAPSGETITNVLVALAISLPVCLADVVAAGATLGGPSTPGRDLASPDADRAAGGPSGRRADIGAFGERKDRGRSATVGGDAPPAPPPITADSEDEFRNFGDDAGDTDREEMERVVREFLQAIVSADGRRVCSLMTDAGKQAFVASLGVRSRAPCARLATKVFGELNARGKARFQNVEIEDVRVSGDVGRVVYDAPSLSWGVSAVERIDGEWLIGSLGDDGS